MKVNIKTILLSAGIVVAGMVTTHAQQPVKTTSNSNTVNKWDSLAGTALTAEQQKLQAEKQAAIESSLKAAEAERRKVERNEADAKKAAAKIEKKRIKAEKAAAKREKEIEKQAKRLEKEQKAREKAANKYDKAVKKAESIEKKLDKQKSKVEKMEDALDKKIRRNRISDLDREKEIIKISKEQIKIIEIERDLQKANNSIRKLR